MNVTKRSSNLSKKHGMTLLEVMLSLFVLLVAISAITGLINLGLQSSADAQQQTIGQILCESKMGEISSGAIPVESTSGNFPNHPDWKFNVTTGTTETPGLMEVRVTVTTGEDQSQDQFQFHLVRLKLDPNFEPETAE